MPKSFSRQNTISLLIWMSLILVIGFLLVFRSDMVENGTLFYVSLLLLTLFSAAFSATETAFTTLFEEYAAIHRRKRHSIQVRTEETRLERWRKVKQLEYNPKDRRLAWAEFLIEEVDYWLGSGFPKVLTLTLVMNNAVNLGGLTVVGFGVANTPAAGFLAFVVTTFMVIIFGEIIAKSIAQRFPAQVAVNTVLLLILSYKIIGWFTDGLVRPVEWSMNQIWQSED